MAKAKPEEKKLVCEESNISLEFSPSLGSTSKVATVTHERSFEVGDQHQRKEYKMEKFGEKKSDGVSSELSHDISQELSLSGNYSTSKGKSPTTDTGNQKSFEVLNPTAGGLLVIPTLGGLSCDDTNCTSKKRERKENPGRTRRNKRTKGEKQERCNEVDTTLRLGLEDPWCIKKQLFESDLGNMSRLMLATRLVESHIFPFWSADQLARIKEGVPVSMWDCDTQTEHDMIFKQWSKGANVLIKNWKTDFVDRRQLMAGDEIGLFWDTFSSRFKFSVLNRAARH